ncbi:twin-arginine translocase TatA/TatE family subunit [Porphyromonadaceae bacterium OttesenSCG-928-L07]|nr:twin-arginine translocase TatA/TatE family subunit [Porphyromonadaceae bacterium OttesenSCG-928-L07]
MELLFIEIGAPEIMFIVIIIVLLFGATRIPGLIKGIGKGIKSVKKRKNGVKNQNDTPSS